MHELPQNRTALLGGRGDSWALDTLEMPTLQPHDVLVEVQAASLNRVDLDMMIGAYNGNDASSAYIAGREAAGIVRLVGDRVSRLKQGDSVMGATPNGGFASYTLMDSRHTIPVPENITWEEAGSLPIGLSTEHDALVTQANFRPDDTVLFLGGSSAIGILGIQMAKALGAATVIATTGTESKRQHLLNAGADFVADTSSPGWPQTVLDATGGRGIDIVLDHLGGEPLSDSLQSVRIGGTIINIGRLAGRTSNVSLDALSFRRLRLQGTTFSVRSDEERGQVYSALLSAVVPAVKSGAIRPLIDSTFSVAEADSAADRLRSGKAVGKIVLTF